jgi:hypothetical protein
MNRMLILLTAVAAAWVAACGGTNSSPDARAVRDDGKPRPPGDAAADGKGEAVAADGLAILPDGPHGDLPADSAGDAGADGTDAAVATIEAGRDTRPSGDTALALPEVGRDTQAGTDTADTVEAGQDVESAADTTVETGEAGRDAGPADSRSKPDAARDATDTTVPDAGPFLIRGNPHKWHVTSTVTVENQNAALTKLSVVLPAPQTNLYQDVANFEPGTGTLLAIPSTDDFYVHFSPAGVLPAPGTTVAYAISYDVTLYDLSVDFSKVTAIPPYDTSAPEYSRYTGPRDVYVDPDNATITAIANSLATSHPDVLTYARAAYEYTANHYQYLNPNTGLHPLTEILAAGGGDCGNLTSIYVSLLRHRGIPARHLVTIRPDGTYHVWADFLLQGYGWVPVDVTYKQADLAGDYFGKVALDGNGIIMDKQVWLAVDIGDSTMEIALLQNYAWWFWSSTPSPTVTASYTLTSVSQ